MSRRFLAPITATAKRIPGLVWVVRKCRAGGHAWLRGRLTAALRWLGNNPQRRSLLFDALPGRLTVAEHARESYLVRTQDNVIGKILYFRGDFDYRKIEKSVALIAAAAGQPYEPHILLDIGANIGPICIPAIKRNLVKRCVAIEPDQENFRLLRINAILNGVDDRLEAHQCAVGDRPGSVSMILNSTNHGDHRVTLSESTDRPALVPMVPLDSFADSLDLASTILWMDIQGFEGFALRGARRFTSKGVPLIFEFSKRDLQGAGCYDLLIDELCSSSYRVFYDLNDAAPLARAITAEALHELGTELEGQKAFTDILVLPDFSADEKGRDS